MLSVQGCGVVACVDIINKLEVQAGITELCEMAAVESGIWDDLNDVLHPFRNRLHLFHAGGVSDAE